MNSKHMVFIAWLFVLIVGIFPEEIAYGNAAEPPGLILLVENPPADLKVLIDFPGSDQQPVELVKQTKAWESNFRFFWHSISLDDRNLTGTRLLVNGGGKQFVLTIPGTAFAYYNNLLTLDFEAERVTAGQSSFRVSFLVGLRVALTLLIEGFIFWLFGYRRRNSWILFFVVNLFTQISLNLVLTDQIGPVVSSYWLFTLVFLEFGVLIAELIAFTIGLKEQTKTKAVWYTILANLSSFVLGGFLITQLPV